ncbi:DUF2846 domain-containing protein [sulfur-oxidizing endosymbiont of Gigantopelta aegis]|uniref:DUF2846 domain-containing protein n=1 Tax=sulfur-oxidizing endosymbiont of Gigantopelta aegis TaxID=2794934 RepID=UPI0018DD714F|nr:DUF2846 domain-containing protein [sulfur-oxidizing endosymbiont of Gigantopelta aegis]
MNNMIRLIIITALLSILSACASVDYSQKKVFPEAKADQALIYFYRTPGFIGSTYRFNVSEGDNVVGAMAQDSYFYLFTEAGEHTYQVADQYEQQGSSIKMTVEAGKTYYVRVDVEYKALGGSPIFTEVKASEAKKLLASRKYVVPAKNRSATYNVHTEQ